MQRPVLIGLLAIAALGVALTTAATSGPVPQGEEFDERSLRGTYGFSALGTILPPALPQPTPAAAVGTMTFDGKGTCSISDTINIGGTSASRTSTSGTYAVAADGSGTMVVTFAGEPGPTPLAFVIVDHRKELRFIRTDLGVAEGVATRQ